MDELRGGRVALSGPDLITKAMEAARYEDTGRFAVEILNVDPRNVRRWLTSERELQGTARVVCLAILERPALAAELAAITARTRAADQEQSEKTPESNA